MEKLNLEVLKSTIETKDALAKVKQERSDIIHQNNLLKIEEDLLNQKRNRDK